MQTSNTPPPSNVGIKRLREVEIRQEVWEERDHNDVRLRWDSYKYHKHVLPLSPISSSLNILTFTLITQGFQHF